MRLHPRSPREGLHAGSALAALLFLSACGGAASPADPSDDTPADTLLWEFATPAGLPLALRADGQGRSYLYVAEKQGGLAVLSTGGGAATEAAQLPISAFDGLHVTALAQQGMRLFVGLGDFFDAGGSRTGLAVVDVQNPVQPAVTARWASPDVLTGTTALVATGNTVYLAAKRDGVFVFDVAQPDTVLSIATFLPDPDFPEPDPPAVSYPNARGFALSGNRLYLADDAGGLRVLDVSDRTAPQEIGRYINAGVPEGKQQAYNAVFVSGDVAYATLDYCGLEILDVSDPTTIRQLGWWDPWACETTANIWFNSGGHTNQIVLDAARHLAYLSAGASELVVVDVADPANPRLRAQYEHPSGDQAVWGLAVTPDETYLGYITALIPYRGTWAGVKAVKTLR